MGCDDCTKYLYLDNGKEPPCEDCYVELDIANHKTWELYCLCSNQVNITAMGDTIGLNHSAVIDTIKLYIQDETQQQKYFEDIMLCWSIVQEHQKDNK